MGKQSRRNREKPGRVIAWSPLHKEGAVLALWPGSRVCEVDRGELMRFFAHQFGIVPTIVGCVTTIPDKDKDGANVPETGGRYDFFFYVDNADVLKFAMPRFQFGMRWWQDIYFNDQQDIYPPDFLAAYPDKESF